MKPQVLSLPSGPGSIEGLGGSFEPQLNTGTSAYSIPIAVAPGRNDLEPKLALQYDSGAGNHHFGIGWKLPLESIHRQFDKGLPRYDDTDVFVYSNGEELVPLADGTWRCENEADFMRYRRDGDGWEVTARNGTVYRLGSSPNARLQNPDATGSAFDRTFTWYVDSVEDTNNNRIEFYYDTPTGSEGERYLTEVRYSFSGDVYNGVLVDYESRRDAFTDYRAGFRRRTAHRGAAIRIESRRALVREYRLSYESTAAEAQVPGADNALPLQVSMLTKVTQFDNRSESFLPPLRLGYSSLSLPNPPAVRVVQNAPLNLVQRIIAGSADLLDVNGDGLPDVLDTTDPVHRYYPNLGRDRFGPVAVMGVGGNVSAITGAALGSDSAVLADMDGDGMSDLIREPGNTVFRNRGNGSWADGAVFDNDPTSGINDDDLRFLDVNFDKATDIVVSTDEDQWLVCDNPNTLDVDYPPYNNFPAGEDVNRNGTVSGMALAAGDWSCRTQAMPFPEGVVFKNSEVQLADMNGDRIQDVVWSQRIGAATRQISYWPGMGEARFDEQVFLVACADPAAPCANTVVDIGHGILDANVRLTDVNGDGLSDLLVIGRGVLRFWINLGGERWSQQVEYTDLPDIDAATALRFADMNGNGTSDIVWIRAVGGANWYYLDFAPDTKPGQLTLIDNGLGRRISIEYASSTEYMLAARDDTAPSNPWTLHAPFPLQVVSRVTTRPSLDLDGQFGDDAYVTDFVYRDAYYDGYEHEFRGFAFVKKIERGDDTAPTQVSRIWFHTGAPDTLDNDEDGDLDERTATGGVEEESLKGRVLRQQVATADGGADDYVDDGRDAPPATVFSTAENLWILRSLHAPDGGARQIATLDERNVTFAFSHQSDSFLTERGQGTPRQIRSTTDYDNFGNVIFSGEEGDISRSGDERYTSSTFAYNDSKWIIDKPASKTVRALPTDVAVVVTESRFYYDGADYVGLPLDQVERGNLIREEAFVANDQYVQKTRKRFDQFGNVIGIMDANGNTGQGAAGGHLDEIEYDSVFHAFPVKETIHVGAGKNPLIMTAGYDFGFGVMTESVDFNGHRSTYGYDSFGRLTSIVKPYDSTSFPTQVFSYHMADPFRGVVFDYDRDGNQTVRDTTSPSFVQTGKREQHGQPGTFDVRQYVDGMGRKLAMVEEGETAFIVKEAVRFNARGTARDTYQPFEAASSDYNLGFANHFTSMVYDATGREVERVNPPETTHCQEPNNQTTSSPCRSSVTTLYRPLEKSVFDENHNEMTYLTDGLAPVDEKGQRLIEVQEVNQGERYRTLYEYNVVDSLTRINDAQNNVKVFLYDGLQRKTFMNDPDRGVMTYVYDAASNLVETIDAKGQRILYAYDGVNRLLSEDYKDETLTISANRVPDVEYHYDDPYGPVDPGDVTPLRTADNTRGFLSWVRDLSGEEHNSYDDRGRVHYVIKRICDPKLQTGRYCDTGSDVISNYKTELTYDAMDRLLDLIYPDNDRVQYGYNSRSLPEFITGGPSGHIIQSIDYAPSGQPGHIIYGNNVETTYSYDPRLRLIDLNTSNPEPPTPEAQHLIHYKYTFDASSNITRIDDARPGTAVPAGDARRNTQIFQYDDLYRLTRVQYSFNLPGEADRSDGFINYTYDRIGNMLSQTSNIVHEERGRSVTNHGNMFYGGTSNPTGGRDNRIGRNPGDPPGPHALTATHSGANPFIYDDNGNMTTLDGMALEWDHKDRLLAVENEQMRSEYTYDYADRRVSKSIHPKPDNTEAPTPDTHVLYIDKHFEVREYDQPVKYVFNGDTRIVRITGELTPSTERVQRIRLYPGWNLVALLVDLERAVEQLANPEVEQIFRWDADTQQYRALQIGEQLPQGAVLWIKARQRGQLTILGQHVPGANSAPGQVFNSSRIFQGTSLDAGRLDIPIRGWLFDSELQEWRVRLAESVGPLMEVDRAPQFISPDTVVATQEGVTLGIFNADAHNLQLYYHQDSRRSLEAMTNANGTVTQEQTSYPFGSTRVSRAIDESKLTKYATQGFISKEFDADTSLYDFGARFYWPTTARFISHDPLRSLPPTGGRLTPQRHAPYAYAINRPFGRADLDGYDDVSLTAGWDFSVLSVETPGGGASVVNLTLTKTTTLKSDGTWGAENNTGASLLQVQNNSEAKQSTFLKGQGKGSGEGKSRPQAEMRADYADTKWKANSSLLEEKRILKGGLKIEILGVGGGVTYEFDLEKNTKTTTKEISFLGFMIRTQVEAPMSPEDEAAATEVLRATQKEPMT